MGFQLNLQSAEETRNNLTEEQRKYIEQLYVDLSKKVAEEAKKAPKTATDFLRQQFLGDLQKDIDRELRSIRELIQGKVEDSMEKAAQGVVDANKDFLKEFDLPFQTAMAHIPPNVVQMVASGQLYEGTWSLSRALWKQEVHTASDINKVIAEGIAQNKSAYDIAKDLEKYVNPKAAKEWDWSKVYPGTGKKVDYNAQRLARTMVSHAYEKAFVESTKDNPFVTEYEWRASGARTCPLCADRDGQHFPKDDLPLDHPNGMCTFIAVIPDSYDQIADRLADWAHGKDDPELEDYAKFLYGNNWNNPREQKPIEYRYHATKRSNIPSIIEHGLKPNRGHLGKGVYFAETTDDALWWTKETSTGGDRLFRVNLEFLEKFGYEEYTAKESGYGVAEGFVDTKIPFTQIEIKVGDNEWWSLAQYAEQYKNSVYRELSKKAQEAVDKQYAKETREWLERLEKKGKLT